MRARQQELATGKRKSGDARSFVFPGGDFMGAVRRELSSRELSERLKVIAETYSEALKEGFADRLISVALFGSLARGEATPSSDIDLLVIMEELPRGRFARRRLLQVADQSIEAELAALHEEGIVADLCVILQTPEEAKTVRPLYLDLVEDAILLFDRDGFLAGALEQLKHSLRRKGARRLRLGKVRYWDLKPDLVPGEIFEI
ncbi:MAG: nucleotidyltransferase domain-containing protein [Armatimonadota bacterium]|nr:nucleotidyltransferase domain-containing protein [Armatimonadota bacterium]MDR7426411.1 nucleotidyltransferase domain-containing protein [Armatimonadota bacterium]MDR7465462.1 nucleotidyltransferase domain-containing protein [Armatimonadota bacterium]MDR7469542.1 nucleotidyltransferase domain-containing protein [Armatimonadota bacterium]MDR7473450.1 nucleotidyltransferase domain-containing protein [Armatimonadota bacterium]